MGVMSATFIEDPRLRPRLSDDQLTVLREGARKPFFHVRNGWRQQGGKVRRRTITVDALRAHGLMGVTVIRGRLAAVTTDLGRAFIVTIPRTVARAAAARCRSK